MRVTVQRAESKAIDSAPLLFLKEEPSINNLKECPTFMNIPSDPNHEDCSEKSNLNIRIEELDKELSRAKEDSSSLKRVVENRNLELQAARVVSCSNGSKQSTSKRSRTNASMP